MGAPVPAALLPDELKSKKVPDDLLPDELRQDLEGSGQLPAARLSGALQGLLAGFGDEVQGAAGATIDTARSAVGLGGDDFGKTFGERYERYRDQARSEFDQYREERPWESFGVTLAGGALPAIATGGSSAATTLSGRAMAGAGTGAAWGGVAGFGSGEGGLNERLASAGQGAAFGAAMGGAVNVVAPHIINAFQYLRGRIPQMFAPNGQLSDAARRGLQELGINPDDVGNDALAQIRADMAKSLQSQASNAVQPQEMASNIRMNEAASLDIPVPQTRGMVTQSPTQQMAENQMRQGGMGAIPEKIVGTAYRQAEDALRANIPATQSRISGSKVPQVTERGQGGAAVTAKLQSMYEVGKAAVDDAWDAARAGKTAGVPAGNVARGGHEIGARLAQEYSPSGSAKELFDVLNGMEKYRTLSGEKDFFVLVRTLIGTRAAISNLTQSENRVLAGASGKAVRYYDEWLNGLYDKALLSGNKEAITQFQKGIAARRDLGRVFESNDLVETLTEMEYRGGQRVFKVALEDASNVILGRAKTPALDARNLARDLTRLKTVLGKGSEWDALREEVFLRFAEIGSHGRAAGAENLFAGSTMRTAWENARRTAKPVMDALFDPQEQAYISKYMRVAQQTTSSVEGGRPLGSGMSNIQILRNIGSLAFAGPRVQALISALPVAGKWAANVAAIPQALRALKPKAERPVLSPRSAAATAGTAGGLIEFRTQGYPEKPEGYPYTVAR